jgi:hypothetical protein
MADLLDHEQNATGSFLQGPAGDLLQVCSDGASPQSEFQPAMADNRQYETAWSFTIVDVVFIRVPNESRHPSVSSTRTKPVARA